MAVNTTGINNITSLQGLASYTNTMTDGLIFTGGIIAIYIIMLIILTKNDEPFINAFTVTSWIMFLTSIFFWFSNLIPTLLVVAFLVFSAFGTLTLYTQR